MKPVPSIYDPLKENLRIFFAIVASGAAILVMILAEMKFFGS